MLVVSRLVSSLLFSLYISSLSWGFVFQEQIGLTYFIAINIHNSVNTQSVCHLPLLKSQIAYRQSHTERAISDDVIINLRFNLLLSAIITILR